MVQRMYGGIGQLNFRFRKSRFIQLGIYHDFIDDGLLYRNRWILYSQLRFGYWENFRFQNKRNLQAIYRSKISEVDFYRMVCAIEPPGLSFDFRLQKGLGINPHMN